MKTIDIGSVLDEGEWSTHQKLLVLATALAIILDGLDNQVLGAAVPALMREWSLPRPAFAWVLASGMFGVILWRVLPESPRYLARRRARWPELATLLRRFGHDVPLDVAFGDEREKAVREASIGQLFVPEYRRDTLALCASYFFCLLTVYIGTTWVPSLLTGAGFSVAV